VLRITFAEASQKNYFRNELGFILIFFEIFVTGAKRKKKRVAKLNPTRYFLLNFIWSFYLELVFLNRSKFNIYINPMLLLEGNAIFSIPGEVDCPPDIDKVSGKVRHSCGQRGQIIYDRELTHILEIGIFSKDSFRIVVPNRHFPQFQESRIIVFCLPRHLYAIIIYCASYGNGIVNCIWAIKEPSEFFSTTPGLTIPFPSTQVIAVFTSARLFLPTVLKYFDVWYGKRRFPPYSESNKNPREMPL